jgi:hypothetical protein
MFGTVLARLKESARGVKPSAQASTSTRRKPVTRETSVPLAIETTREEWLEAMLIERVAP